MYIQCFSAIFTEDNPVCNLDNKSLPNDHLKEFSPRGVNSFKNFHWNKLQTRECIIKSVGDTLIIQPPNANTVYTRPTVYINLEHYLCHYV